MKKSDVQSLLKIGLAFLNGVAGVLAAYPGPELPVLARLMASAVVVGCGAALLVLQPPGSEDATRRVADELERRMRHERARQHG